MGTKAQPQRKNYAPPSPDASLTTSPKVRAKRDEASKSSTARHEVMRNMDAAWFFEFAPDAMLLASRDGRITLVNSHTEKMFGYRREELFGQPVEMLMPERFRNGHVEHRSRYSAAPHGSRAGAVWTTPGRPRVPH